MLNFDEKKEFYKIISFDKDRDNFKEIDDIGAVLYFLEDATLEEREEFLQSFSVYVDKIVPTLNVYDEKRYNLMTEIYYLYDDPFKMLAKFAKFDDKKLFVNKEDISNIYFDTYTFYSDLYSCISTNDFNGYISFKDKLIDYRDNKNFEKNKSKFRSKYGNISREELEKAYEFFLEKEYNALRSDLKFFSFVRIKNENYIPYDIFHLAYTYALMYLGKDRKELDDIFISSRHKKISLFCKICDFDISLLKRFMVENKGAEKHPNYFDWSLQLFNDKTKEEYLKRVFDCVLNSIENDGLEALEIFNQYKAKLYKNRKEHYIKEINFQKFIDNNYNSINKFFKDFCVSRIKFD